MLQVAVGVGGRDVHGIWLRSAAQSHQILPDATRQRPIVHATLVQ